MYLSSQLGKITLIHNKCTITPGTVIPASGKKGPNTFELPLSSQKNSPPGTLWW